MTNYEVSGYESRPGNQPPFPLAPEAGRPAGVIPAASTYTAPPGADPEQAYRQKVVQACVKAAVGTVGIFTSADLSYQDKNHLLRTVSDRNPDRPDAARTISQSGGFGNYGERAIAFVGDAASLKVSKESGQSKDVLAFVEREDGSVDVRYAFSDSRYADGSGRSGNNSLEVGFILPHDAALELRDLVQKDPTLADEIVAAQVLAVGIPEDSWKNTMKPNYGFKYVPDEDRVLEVITWGNDGTTQEVNLPRANRLALLPEPNLATDESIPAHTDSGTQVESAAEKANEALAEVSSDAETQLEHGRTLEKVLENCAANYYSMYLDASDPQLAENPDIKMNAERYCAAYNTVYMKLLEGALLKPDGGQDFVKKYLDDILVRYVKAAAREKGVSASKVSDPRAEFYEEGQAWAIADYELGSVDYALQSQLGVNLTDQGYERALMAARQQALEE